MKGLGKAVGGQEKEFKERALERARGTASGPGLRGAAVLGEVRWADDLEGVVLRQAEVIRAH